MRIKGGARMVQQRKTGLNVRQLKERTSTITVDGKPREVLESEVTRKIDHEKDIYLQEETRGQRVAFFDLIWERAQQETPSVHWQVHG